MTNYLEEDEIISLMTSVSRLYLKFEEVKEKFSNRPDLHALILLDKLVPGKTDIIACSEHDEYFLDIAVSDLSGKITEEQVKDLIRCGLLYDESLDSFKFFT